MGRVGSLGKHSLLPSSSSAGEFSHEEPESEEDKAHFMSSFTQKTDLLRTTSDDSSYTKDKKRKARAQLEKC